MKRINNKGFSLVELLVAFAIAAIAGVAVFGFMSFGSNSFRQTSNDVGLQYEQQLVVNQVRDYILESSNAINYVDTEKTLYTFAQNEVQDAGAIKDIVTVTKILFDKADGSEFGNVKVSSKEYDVTTSNELPNDYKTDAVFAADAMGILSDCVKDISYDLSDIEHNKVTFTITFIAGNGKEVSSTQVVSLRNHVENTSDADKVVSTSESTVSSYIDGIKIYRDGYEVIGSGPEHVGLLLGKDTAKVKFTAEVQAMSKFSTKQYGVKWSISDDLGGLVQNFGTGEISISAGVADGQRFDLTATCIDDTSKSRTITIIIDNATYYPETTKIACDINDKTKVEYGNGYTTFNFDTEVGYRNGSGLMRTYKNSQLIDKIEWIVDGDLAANKYGIVSGMDENGRFTVTSGDSGKTFKVRFKVKQRKADGTELLSQVISLTIGNIDPYTPDAKFSLSCPNSVLRGTDFDAEVQFDNELETTENKYYWKILELNDNASGQWGDSTNAVKTDFDSTVHMRLKDKEDKDILTKVDHELNEYGPYDEGYDGTGWYVSDSKSIKTDVESFLHWNNQYKFKIMVFVVGKDKDGNYVVYDLNGSQTVGATEFKPIKPVEQIIKVPEVKLVLTPSDYCYASGYQYRYDGTTDSRYTTFLTNTTLTPRGINATKFTAPGERRVFNYEVEGLYIYSSEGASLLDEAQGRSFNTYYNFYDKNARVNINVNNKLSPYTVKTGLSPKSSKVDKEVYLPGSSQFLFDLDVRKTKDDGTTSDFGIFHPNKMSFFINMVEKKDVTSRNGSVNVTNSVDSNYIDYYIRYTLNDD